MIRIALAGYGMAGRGIHAPLLQRAGMPVVAVSTRDPARTAQARRELPQAQVVPDLDALLALPGIDLVVLATPSGDHAAQVTACAAAGRAVVVDKPLAVDGESAATAVRAAQAAGVVLTVFNNRRYDPQHTTLRALLAAGDLGEVFRYEGRWERWQPDPGTGWRARSRAEDGGGILLDLHTHLVDAAVDLLGPVERVFARLASRTTVAEDDAFLVCEHRGGATSHLGATSLAGAAGPRLRVLGTAGAYLQTQLEDEPDAFTGLGNAPGQCGWLVRGEHREPVPARPADHADLYRALARAVEVADPSAVPVDPWDAVHVLDVLDAARRSAHSGASEPVAAR